MTVGVGIAAVNTGNNLLYLMLGLLLSLLLISMVMSEVVLYGIRIKRALPRTTTAGKRTVVEMIITNKKRWMPSYALELEDDAPQELAKAGRVHVMKAEANGTEDRRYLISFPKRGRVTFETVRVISRYPFGLVEKSHVHRVKGDVLVYPALEPLSYAHLGGRSVGHESPTGQPGPGSEIAGLRDYRAGDEARKIHALRSAALGRWVVRERERDAQRRLSVALDNRRAEGGDPDVFDERFERMVRRAAFVAQDALNKGAVVQVIAADGSSGPVGPGASLEPVFAFLAELTPSDPAMGAPQVSGHDEYVHLEP